MKLESAELIEVFDQHDDPDVVIPDKVAYPLLFSSQLLLVNSAISIYYHDYGIFIVVTILYLTSMYHWYKPRFSRWARIADYCAVIAAITYGSYYSVIQGKKYAYIWFSGLTTIGIIFSINETLFYLQIMKSVSGEAIEVTNGMRPIRFLCFNVLPTKPNTIERDYVYRRTVWVHLICVHVFANALALGIVISSSQ